MSHVDEEGRARMVPVGDKPVTRRRAVASAEVRMSAEAMEQLAANRLAKGDALAVARIAGVQAAKRTAEWIPLCHTVPLDHVDVEIQLDRPASRARIRTAAEARWSTGVEMEALVAAAASALALYDMLKAVDRAAVVERVRLEEKEGGRRGAWRRPHSED